MGSTGDRFTELVRSEGTIIALGDGFFRARLLDSAKWTTIGLFYNTEVTETERHLISVGARFDYITGYEDTFASRYRIWILKFHPANEVAIEIRGE